MSGACADPAEDAAPTATTTATGGPAAGRTCVAPTFTVEQPPGWTVNNPSEAPPCRWFDPEPFELPENTEAVGIAVHMRYENVPFDRVTKPDPAFEQVLAREESAIDGRTAVRLHLRSTGQGLLDEGTEMVSWYVDTGPHRTFAAATIQTGENFAERVEALDEMVNTVDFLVDVACSAVETAPLVAPAELPEPVRKTRSEIAAAAAACDYGRLAAIASEDDVFSYSFGHQGDFAAFIREAETGGDDPLRKLVQILGTTPRHVQVEGDQHWAWPAAFTYQTWSQIPEPLIAELRPIYDQQMLESFESNGAYIGYRTAIGPEGTWLFFIAGD